MTVEEFSTLLKTLKFKKVTSVNGARGYNTTLKNGRDLTCFAAPDMKSKKALDWAWDSMLEHLAKEYDYKGDVTIFR